MIFLRNYQLFERGKWQILESASNFTPDIKFWVGFWPPGIVCFEVFPLADQKSHFFSKTINFLTKVSDIIWNQLVTAHLLILSWFDFGQFFCFAWHLENFRNWYFKIFFNINENLTPDVKCHADSKYCHLP